MFGIGLGELAVIIVLGIILFGPDKLPEYARQAGRVVKQVRNLAQNAQTELRNELGPEYADLKLTDLDPRAAIRRHILEAMEDEPLKPVEPGFRPLADAEQPPYDLDAT